MKNLKWILIFLSLIAASLLVIILHKSDNVNTAQIIQNGKIIKTINLQGINEPYEFEITSEDGGQNTVRVENGRIGIISANCPDKICVKRGLTDNGTLPIVCLPNKLSIVITNDTNDTDAVTGGNIQ